MKYIRRVLASIRKADSKYDLLNDGDKVVIGVSGGKDSLCLLKALSVYRLFSKKDFTIFPVCLDLGFDGFDATDIEAFASSIGAPLLVKDSREVYPILKEHSKDDRLPCSICSRMKKAAINEAANELGANKVAFAHHQDDAIETLLMNAIHGGRIATFEPKMTLERANITFIRPLIECAESDLTGMAKEEGLPVMGKICPNDGATEREFAKETLHSLYASRDEARLSFGQMLSNYGSFSLFFHCIERRVDRNTTYKPLLYPDQVIEYDLIKDKHSLKPLGKGIDTYLLLYKGKVFGAVGIKPISTHEREISLFEFAPAHEKEAIACLQAIIKQEARKVNPLYVDFKARNKKAATQAGFAKAKSLKGGYSLSLIAKA